MADSANTQENNHIDFEYDRDTAIKDVAGERRHIKFGPASETDGTVDTKKYNGILTCLKANKLYSFSILIDNDDISFIKTLSKSNDIKIVNKHTNNKYIYNFTNSNEYLNNIASIYKGNKDNYMLIIGHLEDGTLKLNVEKIILIINNPFVNGIDLGLNKYKDILLQEEYLNLYYIEHFSLNIPKFIKDKYTPYEEEVKLTSPGTGEGEREDEVTEPDSGDLNEAIEAADGLSEEVIQGEVNKFPDVEGAVGPATVGPAPGVPVTDGSATGVPVAGDSLQGGGKKLASKVKKNKNKKNKVV